MILNTTLTTLEPSSYNDPTEEPWYLHISDNISYKEYSPLPKLDEFESKKEVMNSNVFISPGWMNFLGDEYSPIQWNILREKEEMEENKMEISKILNTKQMAATIQERHDSEEIEREVCGIFGNVFVRDEERRYIFDTFGSILSQKIEREINKKVQQEEISLFVRTTLLDFEKKKNYELEVVFSSVKHDLERRIYSAVEQKCDEKLVNLFVNHVLNEFAIKKQQELDILSNFVKDILTEELDRVIDEKHDRSEIQNYLYQIEESMSERNYINELSHELVVDTNNRVNIDKIVNQIFTMTNSRVEKEDQDQISTITEKIMDTIEERIILERDRARYEKNLERFSEGTFSSLNLQKIILFSEHSKNYPDPTQEININRLNDFTPNNQLELAQQKRIIRVNSLDDVRLLETTVLCLPEFQKLEEIDDKKFIMKVFFEVFQKIEHRIILENINRQYGSFPKGFLTRSRSSSIRSPTESPKVGKKKKYFSEGRIKGFKKILNMIKSEEDILEPAIKATRIYFMDLEEYNRRTKSDISFVMDEVMKKLGDRITTEERVERIKRKFRKFSTGSFSSMNDLGSFRNLKSSLRQKVEVVVEEKNKLSKQESITQLSKSNDLPHPEELKTKLKLESISRTLNGVVPNLDKKPITPNTNNSNVSIKKKRGYKVPIRRNRSVSENNTKVLSKEELDEFNVFKMQFNKFFAQKSQLTIQNGFLDTPQMTPVNSPVSPNTPNNSFVIPIGETKVLRRRKERSSSFIMKYSSSSDENDENVEIEIEREEDEIKPKERLLSLPKQFKKPTLTPANSFQILDLGKTNTNKEYMKEHRFGLRNEDWDEDDDISREEEEEEEFNDPLFQSLSQIREKFEEKKIEISQKQEQEEVEVEENEVNEEVKDDDNELFAACQLLHTHISSSSNNNDDAPSSKKKNKETPPVIILNDTKINKMLLSQEDGGFSDLIETEITKTSEELSSQEDGHVVVTNDEEWDDYQSLKEQERIKMNELKIEKVKCENLRLDGSTPKLEFMLPCNDSIVEIDLNETRKRQDEMNDQKSKFVDFEREIRLLRKEEQLNEWQIDFFLSQMVPKSMLRKSKDYTNRINEFTNEAKKELFGEKSQIPKNIAKIDVIRTDLESLMEFDEHMKEIDPHDDHDTPIEKSADEFQRNLNTFGTLLNDDTMVKKRSKEMSDQAKEKNNDEGGPKKKVRKKVRFAEETYKPPKTIVKFPRNYWKKTSLLHGKKRYMKKVTLLKRVRLGKRLVDDNIVQLFRELDESFALYKEKRRRLIFASSNNDVFF